MGHAPRILVVDDEYSVQLFFEQVLCEVGYYVTLAGNARSALAQARSREFDVVVIDLSLPDRDGLEVIQQLRAEFPLIPILAVSGFMVGKMAQEVMASGATDSLQKPVSAQELLRKIYDLIDPRRTWSAIDPTKPS